MTKTNNDGTRVTVTQATKDKGNLYPMGLSVRAQTFETEMKDRIVRWVTEVDYTNRIKSVTFVLDDKTEYPYEFSFDQIVK